ncbi:protein of unknown function [Pseudodesulfovibrio piezophilus C1TLV30]|uniref:Uncharacterized protein n=1 Tax=Pseudodesulfovibrio piezophilus (strain DSM 21447 / JCM 15486 / C1TLV30) TaxID=1322246 RepID=M1WRK4_PSEP2|nr:protein of unknown function [Pseudodesulfovibrio piezophilus C1TLV30]
MKKVQEKVLTLFVGKTASRFVKVGEGRFLGMGEACYGHDKEECHEADVCHMSWSFVAAHSRLVRDR